MSGSISRTAVLLALTLLGAAFARPAPALAQVDTLPKYLRDRDGGVPSSMHGTYIRRGELLFFPFIAYSRDHDREYQPAALGYGLNEDFRGKYSDLSGQLFIGYGLTDWLAIELEGALLRATLHKSPSDPSATPARIRESGLGDFEGQVRARLVRERERRPELFTFVEMTPPSQRSKALIKEPDWDLKPGIGVIKGFGWGTLMVRVATEWNREAKSPDLGEVTVEYLKRVSPSVRINFALEGGETGTNDEWNLLGGVRWRIVDAVFLKLDNAVGISSKATDWNPQVGLLVSLPNGRRP